MWHSTSAFVGGLLFQGAAVLVSVVMRRTRVFSRTTAWVGILTHGLDLVHIVLLPFLPAAGFAFMAVAGPLYLLWFPLGRSAPPAARRAAEVLGLIQVRPARPAIFRTSCLRDRARH